jgi:hypothetical protein
MSRFRSRKFTTLTPFTRSSRNLIMKSTEDKEGVTKASRGTDHFIVSLLTELYV